MFEDLVKFKLILCIFEDSDSKITFIMDKQLYISFCFQYKCVANRDGVILDCMKRGVL